MSRQVWASAGAAFGVVLLILGSAGLFFWVLYLWLAIGLVQPSRTRSFGIGLWTALLGAAAFVAVRLLLSPQ